jgi:hypothetical protein
MHPIDTGRGERMTDPNYPQQPGPYGAPRGGQQPPPYGQQPYGQQPPPYGQQQPPPYGQQQPPPYGQGGGQDYPPPGQDYPSPPPAPGAPVKKSNKKTFLIIGIAVVVVAVIVIVAVKAFSKNSAAKAGPGDCIKVNSATEKSADVEKIDCNDQVAVFKVAKKLDNDTDNCPSNDYEKYMQSGGGSGDFALCLMLNAKEGDCLANIEDPAKRARVDCGKAQVKVVKVVSGKADESACDQQTIPLVYPEPATTFCISQLS